MKKILEKVLEYASIAIAIIKTILESTKPKTKQLDNGKK